jgi:hypothetical protein
MKKTNVYNIFDLIIIFFSVVMIMYALYFIYKKNHMESFDQNATTSNDTPEDFSKFSSGLTIYTSTMSKKSYPTPTRTWYNISTFFDYTEGACQPIKTSDTNFNFSYVPAFNASNGFLLGNNMIIGPMCHQLGITANDSFSIVMSFKFNEFVRDPENDLELIRLYANTQNNNGLAMYIDKSYTIENGNLVTCKMFLEYANLKFQLETPVINTSYTYMLVIIKNTFAMKAVLYPDIGDLASTSSLKHVLVTTPLDRTLDVLLSNKELVINRNRNIPMNIFNILIFNKAISDFNINDIYAHFQNFLHQSNELMINFNRQIETLRSQLEQGKTCPYDSATCKLCSTITNWNDMMEIVTKGTPDCLKAINNFCKNNPKHPKCLCWDSQNSLSSTETCKAYVSLFSKDVDIEKIKKEYKLCPCGENTCDQKPPEPQKPKLINNSYDVIGKSDIQLYNELPVF